MAKTKIIVVGDRCFKQSIKGNYGNKFNLQLVTDEYIVYGDENESDENANTMLFDNEMNLLSNNYFGFSRFFEVVEENKGIKWESEAVTYWRKQISETE